MPPCDQLRMLCFAGFACICLHLLLMFCDVLPLGCLFSGALGYEWPSNAISHQNHNVWTANCQDLRNPGSGWKEIFIIGIQNTARCTSRCGPRRFSIWNCLSGPGRLTPTSSRKQIFHAGWSCRFGAARSTMQNVTRSPANCHVIQGAMLMRLVLPTAAPLLLTKAGSTGRDAVLRAWGR